ncbi:MAG: Rid family detoxifying hydrolase [Clostridia bacterium]
MKEVITVKNAPAAIGPYNHAIVMEGMVFTSGQVGVNPATGKLPVGAQAQAAQALTNLETVLAAAGASLADVVKTTVFVADLADFATVNSIYAERFGSDFPARSCVQVAALPGSALVEIEAIAFKSADEHYSF